MIQVGKPRVEVTDTGLQVSVGVTSSELPDRLWFSYPPEFEEYLATNSSDWALVSLLIPAMFLGEDLVIEGFVSPLLLQSLRTDLQEILVTQNQVLTQVRIQAESQLSTDSRRSGVGTGFSAGVDSFAALAALDSSPMRPTHLLNFNVGALGGADVSPGLMVRYTRRLVSYC